jgi:hypothetical protein
LVSVDTLEVPFAKTNVAVACGGAGVTFIAFMGKLVRFIAGKLTDILLLAELIVPGGFGPSIPGPEELVSKTPVFAPEVGDTEGADGIELEPSGWSGGAPATLPFTVIFISGGTLMPMGIAPPAMLPFDGFGVVDVLDETPGIGIIPRGIDRFWADAPIDMFIGGKEIGGIP